MESDSVSDRSTITSSEVSEIDSSEEQTAIIEARNARNRSLQRIYFTAAFAAAIEHAKRVPRPIVTDNARARYKIDLWTSGHPEVCWDATGMYTAAFRHLTQELEDLDLVTSTINVSAQIKIGITCWMLRRRASDRTLRDVFQYSLRTIHLYVEVTYRPPTTANERHRPTTTVL